MKTAYCPYCNNHTLVDDRDWGLTIQCEAPRCERFFVTGSAAGQRSDADLVAATPLPPSRPRQPAPPLSRPSLPQRPAAVRVEPVLTGPHHCQVCGGNILQPVGRRRATILHHPDRTRRTDLLDNCRTDVYAAIYRCPNCHEVLETPHHQWGQPVVCPRCRTDFTAPYDDVLHRHEGDAREGAVFQFGCPACGELLRSDTHRHGQTTRGLPVVCVHCHDLITIPGAGVAPGGDHHQADERRCSNILCGQLIPPDSDVCPLCGTVCSAPLCRK